MLLSRNSCMDRWTDGHFWDGAGGLDTAKAQVAAAL